MTIYGWDASHFDAVPSGAEVAAEGFSFMTHKAGGDADDAELAAWWKALKGQRPEMLLGAYWVLYPDNGATRANKFIARLDSQCPGWRDDPFILQVDCEKWNGDTSTVPSKADIKAFCDQLVSRVPKLRPIVYAPEWVYGSNQLAGLGYPLWASRYVTGSGAASALYPGDSSSKWQAYNGQIPAILQFSSSAKIAGQTTCDANAYRGTLAELTALVAPGWKVEVEDVALTDADATLVATKTLSLDGKIQNAPGATDAATNPEISLATAVQRIYDLEQRAFNAVPATGAMVDALSAKVDALDVKVTALGTPTVDVAALAAALAPSISGVTEDEMKALLESIDIKIAPIA